MLLKLNNLTEQHQNLHKVTLAYFHTTPLPICSLSPPRSLSVSLSLFFLSPPPPTYQNFLPFSEHAITSGSAYATTWRRSRNAKSMLKRSFLQGEEGEIAACFSPPALLATGDTTECWQRHRTTGTLKHCWWQYKKKTIVENNLTVF